MKNCQFALCGLSSNSTAMLQLTLTVTMAKELLVNTINIPTKTIRHQKQPTAIHVQSTSSFTQDINRGELREKKNP